MYGWWVHEYRDLTLWSRDLCLCFFVFGSRGFIDGWYNQILSGGHKDDIVSGINQLEFKSNRATSYDGMRISLGHKCCTTCPLRQSQHY